ncbi:hypothetical protein ACF06X_02185 [Streptomyces sp. NPDC015346]|uniref:ferric reductase-like transmembrane domain-containing protein n=1 Tax=Streptomyces sp. NPDC015346 TaxID=3364954 RepID=UPI0036F8391D
MVVIPLLAVGGGDSFRAALDFITGVLSLVSLTASVAWGLTATDRLLLSPRHRLLAQGVHRATAVASLGFLLLHGTVKVSLGRVEPIGALVPFGLGFTGTAALIGFGSLAGLLMVVAAATGALRSTLAGRSRFAARWRPLHMLAYPAWCFALIHGLYAGRPAATWVVVLYCLALAAVAAAVSLRLLPAPTQRALAERFAGFLASLEGRTRVPTPDSERPDPGERPERPERPRQAGLAQDEGSLDAPTVSAEWLDRPGARPSPTAPAPMAAAPPLPQQRLYASPPPPPPFPPAPSAAPTFSTRPGFSAAYRAVSRAAPAPGTTTSRRPDSDIPFAERVPLTEELPVVPDPSPRPGYWPTPSPTMPTYASPPPAGEPWTTPAGDRP